MRKIAAALVAALVCGCVNVYTRLPCTGPRIEDTYQSTGQAFAFSVFVSVPQILNPGPFPGLVWQNLYTIPAGCVCMADTACEAVVDTVLFPVDWAISENRRAEH